jgi:hypothetical protein
MTGGSRLEMVGSPRLVGGFHGVRDCSGVFQALSLTLGTGFFMMSCLGGDFFPCGMMRWMG